MILLEFKYKLAQEEIEEALLDLNWRREGSFRKINLCLMSLTGAVVLIAYMKKPEQFFLFILLVLIIGMLLYMGYGAACFRKRKARKLAAQKGEYRIKVTDKCLIAGDAGEKIAFSGEKLQFLCSGRVLVLRAQRQVVVVPRRILTEESFQAFKRIAGTHNISFINIVLGEE